jgi:ribosomal protein L18
MRTLPLPGRTAGPADLRARSSLMYDARRSHLHARSSLMSDARRSRLHARRSLMHCHALVLDYPATHCAKKVVGQTTVSRLFSEDKLYRMDSN